MVCWRMYVSASITFRWNVERFSKILGNLTEVGRNVFEHLRGVHDNLTRVSRVFTIGTVLQSMVNLSIG